MPLESGERSQLLDIVEGVESVVSEMDFGVFSVFDLYQI